MTPPRVSQLKPRQWSVYILRSTTTGRLYTGISNDVQARLRKHNAGKGAKATRGGRPWVLVYVKEQGSRGAALKEEAAIKALPRAKKDLLVKKPGLQSLPKSNMRSNMAY